MGVQIRPDIKRDIMKSLLESAEKDPSRIKTEKLKKVVSMLNFTSDEPGIIELKKVISEEIAENFIMSELEQTVLSQVRGGQFIPRNTMQTVLGKTKKGKNRNWSNYSQGSLFEKFAGGKKEAGENPDIASFMLTAKIIIPLEAKIRAAVTEYANEGIYSQRLSFLGFVADSIGGDTVKDYAIKKIEHKMENLLLGRWEWESGFKGYSMRYIDIELYLTIKSHIVKLLIDTDLIDIRQQIGDLGKISYKVELKFTELAKILYTYMYKFKDQFELLKHTASQHLNIMFRVSDDTILGGKNGKIIRLNNNGTPK